MKIKTSELNDDALMWAAAKADGRKDVRVDKDDGELVGDDTFDYLEWYVAGPIIEREKLHLQWFSDRGGQWRAATFITPKGKMWPELIACLASTPLIAAMRCFVASKLGDEVDVPDGLV